MKMKIVASFICVAILLCLAGVMFTCQCCLFAEEGTYFHLYFRPDEKFNWVNFLVDSGDGYHEMTKCFSNRTCHTNNANFMEYLIYNETTKLDFVVMEMKAANRKYANWTCVWEDVYKMSHTTQPCNMTIYVLPVSPECHDPVFENSSMILKCGTKRVFPPAKCRFVNYTPLYIEPTVNYSIQTSPISKEDFSVSCTFNWKLPPVIEQTTLTLAAGLSPAKSIEVLTPNVSINLIYPSAELDKDCPVVIEVGSSATCTCKLITQGSPPGKAFWYSMNETVNVIDKSDGSSQLELAYNSTVQNPVFYCSSKSEIGQQKSSKMYIPKFFYVTGEVDIQIKGYPEVDLCNQVVISCLVSGNQLNTGSSGHLTINGELVGNHTTFDNQIRFLMTYILKPNLSEQYQISCVLRNTLRDTVVADVREVLIVDGDSCADKNNGNIVIYILAACVCVLGITLVAVFTTLIIKHRRSSKVKTSDLQPILAEDDSIKDNTYVERTEATAPYPTSSYSYDNINNQDTEATPIN